MMGHRQVAQTALFYEFSLKRHVPLTIPYGAPKPLSWLRCEIWQLSGSGVSSMTKWVERFAAAILIVAAAAASLYAFHVYSRPVDLRIAVGPPGSDDNLLLGGLSLRLTDIRAKIHLSVLSRDGPIEAAQALERGEADLAVIRGDLPVPSAARAIALLSKSAVIVIAPEKKKIADFGDLKNRRLGIVGPPDANSRLIDQLVVHFGLQPSDIARVPLGRDEAVDAIRKGRVDAVMATVPLSGKAIANFNAAASRALRGAPSFVDIDADAIAKSSRQYESDEIPAGTFRSSPAIPPEGISTLLVANLLVARSTLSEDEAAALTRLIFESRQPLASEYPTARLIEAASTDKDALVPIHPGAAAYYDDSEKTFFDRYGDFLFYGPMFLSLFGTVILAVYRHLTRRDRSTITAFLDRLRLIADDAMRSTDVDKLNSLDCELNKIFDAVVANLAHGGLGETEISTVLAVLKYVSDTLSDRRRALLR